MISYDSNRKKTKPGGGVLRLPQDNELAPILRRRGEIVLLLLSFVVLLAALTKPPTFTKSSIGYDIDSQAVALEEVRAEIYFEAENLQATKQKRDEAAQAVPDTYRVDREDVENQLKLLDKRIDALLAKREEVDAAVRKALSESNSSQTDAEIISKAVLNYATQLKKEEAFQDYPDADMLALWLMPTEDSVPKRVFEEPPETDATTHPPLATTSLDDPDVPTLTFTHADELKQLTHDILEYVLVYGIRERVNANEDPERTIMVMREDPPQGQNVSDVLKLKDVPTPDNAMDVFKTLLVDASQNILGEETESPIDWAVLQKATLMMAKPCITGTLFEDRVSTESAREQARLEVEPVLKEIQPGEVIQRSGDKWNDQKRSDVRTYWAAQQRDRNPGAPLFMTVAAHMIFVALILMCLVRSTVLLSSKRQDAVRNLNLVMLLTCSTAIIGRVVSYFEPSGFVVPSTAAVILLTILVNARVAAMSGLLIAALVSIQFGYDWRLLMVGSVMAMAGVFGTDVVRRRSDMTRSVLKATLAGVLAMVAITLAMDSLASSPAIRRISLILLNGGACLFIIPGLLSPLERLFGITTDIQLLEYSDLNNDLLRRIAIEMPATYAHSLMLGQLVEAAAEAIGANGLRARVCAYYHDAGKLRRPEYFSENQRGSNIHDEMPPRVSSRAIAGHVTYGIELAREYHLPKPIVDGILEHHGTCLISFFYQQAREQHKHNDVVQEDYRYAGPKPQSRETAILMICDAVESGIRSIKNPNEERVREFVDKVITARSADRQFDECPLTLKDLDTIKETVTQRMVIALHPRISYPETKGETPAGNVIPISGEGA